MSSAAATTVIVAHIAQQQKRVLDALKAKGAVSPESATREVPGGKDCGSALKMLLKGKQVEETGDGRYFLTDKGLKQQAAEPPSGGKVLLIIGAILMVTASVIALVVTLAD